MRTFITFLVSFLSVICSLPLFVKHSIPEAVGGTDNHFTLEKGSWAGKLHYFALPSVLFCMKVIFFALAIRLLKPFANAMQWSGTVFISMGNAFLQSIITGALLCLLIQTLRPVSTTTQLNN